MEDLEITLRRGQLCLIVAGSGTGKSGWSLNYAIKTGLTGLYFSADSDAFEQLKRSISVVNGCSQSKAAQAILDDDLGEFEQKLREIPIRFNFEASPSLDVLELEIEAYEELYGNYPAMIIIDNITNVRNDGEEDDPFSGLEGLLDYLHDMARRTQAAVFVLHHTTGQYNNGDKPIPLDGTKQQIHRVPEVVITIHKPNEDRLCISPVKMRGGRADPSGNLYAELAFEGSRMAIEDVMEPESSLVSATANSNPFRI